MRPAPRIRIVPASIGAVLAACRFCDFAAVVIASIGAACTELDEQGVLSFIRRAHSGRGGRDDSGERGAGAERNRSVDIGLVASHFAHLRCWRLRYGEE